MVTPFAMSAAERVISDQEVPWLLPPQPANENTGFFTGCPNESVSVPRSVHNVPETQFTFVVVSFKPGSVTRPVATKSSGRPPRCANDSVTSLMHKYGPATATV